MRDAADESVASHQRDFPVLRGGKVVGLVFYNDVVRALKDGEREQRVSQIMRQDCLLVEQEDPLDQALDKMHACDCRTWLVQDHDKLVGMISEEHLGQWMMLHSSFRERQSQRPTQAA